MYLSMSTLASALPGKPQVTSDCYLAHNALRLVSAVGANPYPLFGQISVQTRACPLSKTKYDNHP